MYRDPQSMSWLGLSCLCVLGGCLAVPVVVSLSPPSDHVPVHAEQPPQAQPISSDPQLTHFTAAPRFESEEQQLPTREQLRDPVFRRNFVGPVIGGDPARNRQTRLSIWDMDYAVARRERELERESIINEAKAEEEANRRFHIPLRWPNWDVDRELELVKKLRKPDRNER